MPLLNVITDYNFRVRLVGKSYVEQWGIVYAQPQSRLK